MFQHTRRAGSKVCKLRQAFSAPLKQRVQCVPMPTTSLLSRFSSASGLPPQASSPLVDFSDTERAFKSKSVGEILRALAIYQMCTIDTFVKNSEALYNGACKVFGQRLVDFVVRPTFFGHFCAGEDEQSIKPTINRLASNGVGGILDYAAEADVDEVDDETADFNPGAHDDSEGVFEARVYHYSTEVMCDANAEIFHQAIKSVHNVLPEGFAAVKITALGNPQLLERITAACNRLQTLFRDLDRDGDGLVYWEEFRDGFPQQFGDVGTTSDLEAVFEELVCDSGKTSEFDLNTSAINYTSWGSGMMPEKMLTVKTLVDRLYTPDAVATEAAQTTAAKVFLDATLNDEEQALLKKMFSRIESSFAAIWSCSRAPAWNLLSTCLL